LVGGRFELGFFVATWANVGEVNAGDGSLGRCAAKPGLTCAPRRRMDGRVRGSTPLANPHLVIVTGLNCCQKCLWISRKRPALPTLRTHTCTAGL
jgi:hypothetical protein